jgi:hypothetical protein
MENVMTSDFVKTAISKIEMAKSTQKQIVFTIASTAKIESKPYLTPLREFDKFCVLGCVLFNQEVLLELIKIIDGIVDVILIDAEKKIPLQLHDDTPTPSDAVTIGNFETGNFSKICFKHIKLSKVFEYKPNDLTVNSAWMFLSQKLHFFTGKKICILGLGNIGSKLALKLVECGADVHVYSKEHYKTHLITQALNLIKHVGTIASITCHRDSLTATFSSDVLIGATNGVSIITDEIIKSVSKKCLILDLGKNNITQNAALYAKSSGLEICRTDVTSAIESFVSETFSLSNTLQHTYGECRFENCVCVSGGYFGETGAIVVDNYKLPKVIYGVCDGFGSLKKEYNQQDKLNILWIKEEFECDL